MAVLGPSNPPLSSSQWLRQCHRSGAVGMNITLAGPGNIFDLWVSIVTITGNLAWLGVAHATSNTGELTAVNHASE